MDDRAICLPWGKNFVLAPLGQTVVYGKITEKFTEIYKRIRVILTDTKKSSIGG